MHYVYVLLSLSQNKFYIGRTDDLRRRIDEHKAGQTWTTLRFLPIPLLFYAAFFAKEDAIRREKYLKTSKGRSTLKMMLQVSLCPQ